MVYPSQSMVTDWPGFGLAPLPSTCRRNAAATIEPNLRELFVVTALQWQWCWVRTKSEYCNPDGVDT